MSSCHVTVFEDQKMSKIILVVFVAVITFLVFKPDDPITGKKLTLGENKYDIELLVAPAATGTFLDAFSYVLTKSRLGPFVRRILLNDNKILNLRELASQISLPPLYFPCRRLNNAQYTERSSDSFDLNAAVQNGFGLDYSISQNHPRSIQEYAEYYRKGHLPSDVLKRTLKTIREWESKGFNIFSSVIEADVLKQAEESDKRFKSGKPLSIFDGVPFAFKDQMDVAGHIIYEGTSPKPEERVLWTYSTQDDLMIKRIKELGGIILGVTIMVEGGVSPLGYNTHFQGPVNPYSVNRYSGGSSSGSAVAVATGLVPVAIGFDGGGSIRIPSAMSGIHGLATTFGRIPYHNHTTSTMIKSGPMTASSQDAALTYAVISQNDPTSFYGQLYDGGNRGPPVPHLDQLLDVNDLSDVRIGIYPEWYNDSQPEIREKCDAVIEYLKSKGATIVNIHVPHLQWMSLSHGVKISTEFAIGYEKLYHNKPDSLEPQTRIIVSLGSEPTALEILAAEKIRHWGFKYITELFERERLTAIINPTLPIEIPILSEEAKKRGESDTTTIVRLLKYIFIGNFLGLPGYSVPVGYISPVKKYPGESEDLKVPVGLHLLGDHWTEHKLLRLANSIEFGYARKLKDKPKPMFFYDPLQ